MTPRTVVTVVALGFVVLAGCVQPNIGCDELAVRLDGEPTMVFGGESVPAGSYQATYVRGAMRYDLARHPDQWSVHGLYGPNIAVVQASGRVVTYLPGDWAKHPSQAAVELANRGAAKGFDWPGGPMALRLFDDDYSGNLGGTADPTWDICHGAGALAPSEGGTSSRPTTSAATPMPRPVAFDTGPYGAP